MSQTLKPLPSERLSPAGASRPGLSSRGIPSGSAQPAAAIGANVRLGARDASDRSSLCQTCGACCAYSREWPRFSLESDAALDRIPVALIADGGGGMRCLGDRCAALVGKVGEATACSIYALRPDVCRECLPGDAACATARQRFDL